MNITIDIVPPATISDFACKFYGRGNDYQEDPSWAAQTLFSPILSNEDAFYAGIIAN